MTFVINIFKSNSLLQDFGRVLAAQPLGWKAQKETNEAAKKQPGRQSWCFRPARAVSCEHVRRGICSSGLRIYILPLEIPSAPEHIKALKCPTALTSQYSDVFQTYFTMKPFFMENILIPGDT